MQRKTAEAQWHLLTSNLEVMGIRIGTKVLPLVTDFVHFLATKAMPEAVKFGKAIGNLIPVNPIKQAVGRAKGIIDDFLKGFRGSKNPVSDLVKGLVDSSPHLGSSKTAVASKGPALAPMPHYGVGQVAPSNGRIVSAGQFATPHGGSGLTAPLVKAKVKPPKSLAQQIGEQVRIAFTDGIMHVNWDKFGPVLGGGLGKAFAWVASHGAELSAKLGKAIGGIDWVDVGKSLGKIALPFAIGFTVNLFEPMMHADFWKKHWLDTILAVISVVPLGKVGGVLAKLGSKVPWGRLGEVLSKIPWQKLIPFGERLARAAGPIFMKINEFVARMSLKFLEAFARHFPRIAAWFSRELGLLPIRLGILGLELARKGNELIGTLGRALVERLPGAGNRFIRAAYKAFGRFTLYQIGVNLAKSLTSGAWNVMKSIGSWLKGHIVDPITNGVKSLFGIKSPSRVFMSIGRNLIVGLKSGILGAVKGIGGWIVDHIVSPVRSPFAHAGSWLPGRGSSMVSGFKSGASSVGKTIGSWVTSHVINPVKSPFTHSRGWLPSKGSALVSGLKSGITGAMKGIGGWVKGVMVDPIVGAVKRFFGIKSPSRVFMASVATSSAA
jgi:hypothetical protein